MASFWEQLQTASKALSEQAQSWAGTFDGIAETLVNQVNHASAEMKEEHDKLLQEQSRQAQSSEILLPWETREENKSILVDQAMASILQLSMQEETFTHPPETINDFTFDFETYVPVVLRLLELDANLSRMQSHFASRMKEEVFWHNYFMHTRVVRQRVGLSMHDDIIASPAAKSPATEEVRRVVQEEESEDSEDDIGSALDLSDEEFENVDADDLDEDTLEQEIAKELEEDI